MSIPLTPSPAILSPARPGPTLAFAPDRAPSPRACFIAGKATAHCPFDTPLDIMPADAEEGGLAKLFTARLASGQTIAVKRFHATRELDGPLFEQHLQAAADEFDRMVDLDGADGHAPRAFALGSCFDESGHEHPAIAMTYIEGFTLEYALRASLLSASLRTRDKTQAILSVGLHVARALKACGACAHRDLNPRNVMLVMNPRGEIDRAVIIDFGQSVEAASPLVTPSARPHRLATISFGAPEIYGGPFYACRNEAAVDVYSFGALLHYLRTRTIPFLDLSALDASRADHAQKIVAAKRTPLDTAALLGPSLRPIERKLADLVAACTAFNPSARPGIDAIIAQLSELTGETARAEGTPAQELQTPEQLLKQAENHFYGHAGLTRSRRLARESLERAAEAGNPTAQFKLGKSLALGQHERVDAAKARFWLEAAAAAGHPGAAVTLRALAL